MTPRLRAVPPSDWPGKRIVGAVGLFLLKRRYLADVRLKLQRLAEFARDQKIDLVLCSGDHTVLGTRREFADARRAEQPFLDAPQGFVTVPGNHDLYTPDTVRERRFEEAFGDLLRSDAPQYAVDGPWPLVRLVGESTAVVAVNSAEPRLAPWQSGGRIPASQLEALEAVVAEPWMRERFIFVMTHHAPRLASGRPDRVFHGLQNHVELLSACSGIERGAVLFGHVHHCFRLKLPELNVVLHDAGSVTMRGREGFWLFELQGRRVRATRGRWSVDRYVLDANQRHEN